MMPLAVVSEIVPAVIPRPLACCNWPPSSTWMLTEVAAIGSFVEAQQAVVDAADLSPNTIGETDIARRLQVDNAADGIARRVQGDVAGGAWR